MLASDAARWGESEGTPPIQGFELLRRKARLQPASRETQGPACKVRMRFSALEMHRRFHAAKTLVVWKVALL